MAEVEEWTVQDALRLKQQQEGLDAGNNLNVDYEHATKVLGLMGKSGLPWEVIDHNPDAVEAAVGKADFSAERWIDESPEFADFASQNPMHLAVLKSDEKNLTWFEREWSRPMKLAIGSTVSQVRLNQLQNRRRQGREYWLDGDEEEIDRLKDQIQEHNFGASGSFRPLIWGAKQLGPMGYIAVESLDEAMGGAMLGYGIGGTIGLTTGTAILPGPGTVVGGLTLSLVGMGIGASIGATVGGAKAGFEMMAGEQYDRFIEADFSHEHAARVATITGAISTIPETAGIGKLLRGIPDIDQAVNWGAEENTGSGWYMRWSVPTNT